MQEPRGFWEVVGHEPFVYAGVTITRATFASESSARKFAEARGGEAKHREADFILIDGKIVWERA